MGDLHQQATTCEHIGLVYFLTGEYENSLSSYKQALDLRRKIAPEDLKNQQEIADIFDLRGRVYAQMGNFDFAMADYRKALRLARKTGSVAYTANTLNDIGALRLKQNQPLLAEREDFVVKPNRGASGRGILVVTGRDGATFLRHNGQRLQLGDIHQHVSSVVSGLFSLGGHNDAAIFQQSLFGVTSLWEEDALIEIEAIACLPEATGSYADGERQEARAQAVIGPPVEASGVPAPQDTVVPGT